jgi:hypothetical protein
VLKYILPAFPQQLGLLGELAASSIQFTFYLAEPVSFREKKRLAALVSRDASRIPPPKLKLEMTK